MNNSLMTETVNQIGRMNITGNVIPANWWHHIKMPSGKPDNIGIILLSEIIYWYRPAEIRDEFTGELQGWRKRFQSDKLQRSYQSFADQFGFTKREVTEAIKRLKAKGVITLEFRTINTVSGPCNNVVFIEPVVECIHEITNSIPLIDNQTKIEPVSVTGLTSKRDRGYVETEQPPHTEVIAPTSKRETNTEITTETTTEIINGTSGEPDDNKPSPKIKLNYEKIIDSYHEILPDMPAIKVLTDERKRKIKNFWIKFKFNQERWVNYLSYIAIHCRWMMEDRDNGRGGTWRRKNLDYLATERCYVAVKEERANDK
ncbi:MULTISPECIES: hypothetical protein [Providencia]|uniref:hypothetical protein n=1 Tax=Providencia TaxID=586 RepID=UPI000F773F5D|nr:hypothetical protein [Providencia rettgeri]